MDDLQKSPVSGEIAELLRPVVGKEAERCQRILLDRYLMPEAIFSANFEEMCGLVGQRAAEQIHLLARITSRRLTDRFQFGKIHTQCEIVDYLKALFLGLSSEHLYLISFGSRGEVVSADLVGVGTVNSAAVTPRTVVDFALKRKAKSIILAHNHPGGRPEPSPADVEMLSTLSAVVEKSGIRLLGHIIIAGSRHYIVSSG